MQLVPFHVYTYTCKIASLASSACIWSKYYDNRTRTFQKKKALKYIYGLNEFLSKIVCGYFVRPAFNMVNCNSYLTCVVPSPHFSTLSVSVKKGAKGKGVGGGGDSDLVPRSQRTAFKQTSTIWRLAHCLLFESSAWNTKSICWTTAIMSYLWHITPWESMRPGLISDDRS